MEIVKFCLIGIVGGVVYLIIKKNNPELAPLSLIATSVVLVLLLVDEFVKVVGLFQELSTKTGISSEVFKSVIKVIIISYITEFSKSLCDDMGVSSIGNKILLGGKIAVLIIISPILYSLFTAIMGLVQ